MLVSDGMPPTNARIVALAERDPRRAVPVARRLLASTPGDNATARAWAMYTLGWCLMRWERLSEAIAQLRQARDAFSTLHMDVPALHARFGELIAVFLYGSKAPLIVDLEALAAAYIRHDLPLDAARVQIYQGGLLNLLGHAPEALALAADLRPVIECSGMLADQGRLLRMIAIAQGDCGDFDSALQTIDQALAYFRLLDMRVEAARCWLERSWLLQRQEVFEPALSALEQAQTIFRQTDMPIRLGFCDEHIGLLASRIGRYEQALAATMRARAIFATLDRPDLMANCTLHLGIVSYYCGLFDLAFAAFYRARLVYTELGVIRLSYVCQRNTALVLRAWGRPADALTVLNEIAGPVRAQGERLEFAEIMYAQAQAAGDLRQNQAVHLFQEAESLFIDIGNRASAAKCRLDLGWLYLEHGQLADAAACLVAALPALESRPFHRWRIEYGLGRCAILQGQLDKAFAHYRAASAIVAKLRELSSEHASSQIFAQARQLFVDALQLAYARNDAYAVLDLADQQRELAFQHQLVKNPFYLPADLHTVYEQQREQLRALCTDLPSQQALAYGLDAYIDVLLQARHATPSQDETLAASLDIQEVRRALNVAYPEGWAAVTYVPCEETLLIVEFDAHTVALTETAFDSRLRELLERACLPAFRPFTYLTEAAESHGCYSSWPVLSELADRLIPPSLRDRLHPELRLLIVASGTLHQLPWAALRLSNTWLVERAVVQLVPSLQLWLTLKGRRPTSEDALLIGCHEFGGRARSLPNALPSLDVVERLWLGATTRLEQQDAQRQRLLNFSTSGELRRYGLVHCSTHGQFVAAHGLLAHLKLADDELFYDEIARLHLSGALVVLAACDGAAVEVLLGEEVLSLSRALLSAGARDVIASLWQIYDGAILGLLEPLYQALAAGQDAPRALASAQRYLILQHSCHGAVTATPLVWANFCVLGAGTVASSLAGGTKSANALPTVSGMD